MTLRRAARLAAEAVLLEVAVYRALVRWVARRPDVPDGTRAVGYAQLVGPMLWLWIFGSATEVVVVEVVLRQVEAGWAEALRLPLLVVGVWGVLWMLGLLAAHHVRPHLWLDERLVARGGLRAWADVSLADVRAVRATEHELPGTVRTLHHDPEGGLLLVGVSGRTNVELTLAGPTPVATSAGTVLAERVGLWVDEPRAVAGDLARHVAHR